MITWIGMRKEKYGLSLVPNLNHEHHLDILGLYEVSIPIHINITVSCHTERTSFILTSTRQTDSPGQRYRPENYHRLYNQSNSLLPSSVFPSHKLKLISSTLANRYSAPPTPFVNLPELLTFQSKNFFSPGNFSHIEFSESREHISTSPLLRDLSATLLTINQHDRQQAAVGAAMSTLWTGGSRDSETEKEATTVTMEPVTKALEGLQNGSNPVGAVTKVQVRCSPPRLSFVY